ncbi:MAG: hypothetical protein PVH26_06480 [Desulfosarcina sp.]|jgi:hypothetical protein
MEYKAGTMSEYADSMAEKMRTVFEGLWRDQYGYDLPSESRVDRRMLFVAIAQGVIHHLKNNAVDAFNLDVTVDQTSPSLIESEGDTDSSGTHDHQISSVTQKNFATNKVKCRGQGKDKVIVNILTTGDLL